MRNVRQSNASKIHSVQVRTRSIMASSTAPVPCYRLFDLTIASALDLPGLPHDEHCADPDISVTYGSAEGDGFLLEIPEVANYLVTSGRSIVIEPVVGCDERNLRLFLLGSAMGIALHQRNLLPLHANAIVLDGRAFAFMGHSGAGKSTLAAWFHDRGVEILSDDVCVIRFGKDGVAQALPGPPRLRLWRDALEASGRDPSQFERSFVDDEAEGDIKFDVPAQRQGAHPTPLSAIFLLDRGPFEARRLQGVEAVEALSANTYRGGMILEVGDKSHHVRDCARLAKAVPIHVLRRPIDRQQFDRNCERILKMLCQDEWRDPLSFSRRK